MSTTVAGWPSDTPTFFAELAADNRKNWFDANTTRHRAIEEATRAFLDSSAADGDTVKVFRLRRDARFSKGQPPYKTELRGGIMRADGAVEWIDLSATGVTISAGHPVWDRDQLAAARAAFADPTAARALATALDEVRAAGLALDPPELKNPARGLSEDHPDPEVTRHKHLAVSTLVASPPWLSSARAGEEIRRWWSAAAPLRTWLGDHVGPPADR